MELNFEEITRKRKRFIIWNFLFILIIGGLMFPLSFTKDFSLLIITLVGYFFVGFIFVGLYEKRPFVVFSFTFLLNVIALSWRVFLEWGEVSMVKHLTFMNVGIFLTFIPLYVTIVFLVLQQIKWGQNGS